MLVRLKGSELGCCLIVDLRPEFLLFGEAPSRILVSTSVPERVKAIAHANGVDALRIGDTIEGELIIQQSRNVLINRPVAVLRECWSGALENLLHIPDLRTDVRQTSRRVWCVRRLSVTLRPPIWPI